jgi:hypothetical protein
MRSAGGLLSLAPALRLGALLLVLVCLITFFARAKPSVGQAWRVVQTKVSSMGFVKLIKVVNAAGKEDPNSPHSIQVSPIFWGSTHKNERSRSFVVQLFALQIGDSPLVHYFLHDFFFQDRRRQGKAYALRFWQNKSSTGVLIPLQLRICALRRECHVNKWDSLISLHDHDRVKCPFTITAQRWRFPAIPQRDFYTEGTTSGWLIWNVNLVKTNPRPLIQTETLLGLGERISRSFSRLNSSFGGSTSLTQSEKQSNESQDPYKECQDLNPQSPPIATLGALSSGLFLGCWGLWTLGAWWNRYSLRRYILAAIATPLGLLLWGFGGFTLLTWWLCTTT